MRRYTIEVNGKPYLLDVREQSSDHFEVIWGNQRFDVLLVDDADLPEAAITPVMSHAIGAHAATAIHPAVRPAPKPVAPMSAAPGPGGHGKSLTAPMPGVILSVDVKAGAHVLRGDVLCKLEAMKMVNPIRAPKDAVITEIAVAEGQTVAFGDALVRFGE